VLDLDAGREARNPSLPEAAEAMDNALINRATHKAAA